MKAPDQGFAFVVGVFFGVMVGLAAGAWALHSMKEEAITLGYAKMVLQSPTDNRAIFTWVDPTQKTNGSN